MKKIFLTLAVAAAAGLGSWALATGGAVYHAEGEGTEGSETTPVVVQGVTMVPLINVPDANPVVAGTVIADTEFFKAETVYDAQRGAKDWDYSAEIVFHNRVASIRNNGTISAETPFGEARSNATPIKLTVKKAMSIVVFFEGGKPMQLYKAGVAQANPMEYASASNNRKRANLWTLEAGEYCMTSGDNNQLYGFGEAAPLVMWSAAEVNLVKGGEFTAPTLLNAPAEGVAYASRQPLVATVSDAGAIALGEYAGNAVVTATVDGKEVKTSITVSNNAETTITAAAPGVTTYSSYDPETKILDNAYFTTYSVNKLTYSNNAYAYPGNVAFSNFVECQMDGAPTAEAPYGTYGKNSRSGLRIDAKQATGLKVYARAKTANLGKFFMYEAGNSAPIAPVMGEVIECPEDASSSETVFSFNLEAGKSYVMAGMSNGTRISGLEYGAPLELPAVAVWNNAEGSAVVGGEQWATIPSFATNGQGEAYQFLSKQPEVASVDENGVVTLGTKLGNTVILAYHGTADAMTDVVAATVTYSPSWTETITAAAPGVYTYSSYDPETKILDNAYFTTYSVNKLTYSNNAYAYPGDVLFSNFVECQIDGAPTAEAPYGTYGKNSRSGLRIDAKQATGLKVYARAKTANLGKFFLYEAGNSTPIAPVMGDVIECPEDASSSETVFSFNLEAGKSYVMGGMSNGTRISGLEYGAPLELPAVAMWNNAEGSAVVGGEQWATIPSFATNGQGEAYQFESKQPEVASVDENGVVTLGTKLGNTVILAYHLDEAGNKTDVKVATVTYSPSWTETITAAAPGVYSYASYDPDTKILDNAYFATYSVNKLTYSNNAYAYPGDVLFSNFVECQIDGAPNAENPFGTYGKNSRSGLKFEVKKATGLKIYARAKEANLAKIYMFKEGNPAPIALVAGEPIVCPEDESSREVVLSVNLEAGNYVLGGMNHGARISGLEYGEPIADLATVASWSVETTSVVRDWAQWFTAPLWATNSVDPVTFESKQPAVATVSEAGAVALAENFMNGNALILATLNTVDENDNLVPGETKKTAVTVEPDPDHVLLIPGGLYNEYTFIDQNTVLGENAYVKMSVPEGQQLTVSNNAYVWPQNYAFSNFVEVRLDGEPTAEMPYGQYGKTTRSGVVVEVKGEEPVVLSAAFRAAPGQYETLAFYKVGDATPIYGELSDTQICAEDETKVLGFATFTLEPGTYVFGAYQCGVRIGGFICGKTSIITKSGIMEVLDSAAEGPVEYYNLQGVRVANPENGIYIRRQGNKVQKVLVK